MTSFIHRMVDPDVGSGATDVYGIMFGCQFIIFLIILFSWSAFAEAEVRSVVYEFLSDVESKQRCKQRIIATISIFQHIFDV